MELTKDLTIDGTQFYPLKLRAYSLGKVKDFRDAFELIDKLIPLINEKNEFLSDLYDTLGEIYMEKGEKEKAIEYFQKTLNICENEYPFITETRRKLNELKSEK